MTRLLVFTDLDGTLLDHDTYSFAAATQALAEIRARNYPLVLVSSKTSAELQVLQEQLQIAFPYVSENGAAVFWHEDGSLKSEVFATPRARLLEIIQQLRSQYDYQFRGFADCSVSDIVAMTGLDESAASLAASRDFTEPLLWSDTEERFKEFQSQLSAHGLRVLSGGRFRTVMGQYDKGEALQWLKNRYSQQGPVATVALGDGLNDEQMLNSADIAVVIHSAQSSKLQPVKPQSIIRTELPGPQGWQQAMTEILNKYNKV